MIDAFGSMTQQDLNKRIKDHELWLQDKGGVRLYLFKYDLIGMELSGDLSRAVFDLSDFTFTTITNAKLHTAQINECDFSNSIMSNVEFNDAKITGGCKFLSAEIKDTNFHNSTLEGANFNGAKLTDVELGSADIDDASFIKAELTSVGNLPATKLNMNNVNCEGGIWKNCAFHEATIRDLGLVNSNFSNVIFFNCHLYNPILTDADWFAGGLSGGRLYGGDFTGITTDGSFIKDCYVEEMDAPKLDFSSLSVISGTTFNKCKFVGSTADALDFGKTRVDGKNVKSFANSDFTDGVFIGCNFSGIHVYGCNFSGADLSGATMNDVFLRKAKFIGMKATPFTMVTTQAYLADFSGADGGNWFISNSEMSRTDFKNSTLTGKFEHSDFTGASFFNADVDSISFPGADLTGARWVNGERCQIGSDGVCIIKP